MKIAYCLSGFLRSYKNNNFFENMVSKVPGDVFIHTWNEIVPGTPLDVSEAYSYYKPAGFLVEDQFKFKQSLKLFGYEDYLQNYICMWKSISSSIRMALNYDVIIRFRPDLLVENEFDIKEIEDTYSNKRRLFFGSSDDCYHADLLTDNFAFGSNKVMSIYANHYEHSLRYRPLYQSNERALTAFIEHNKMFPDGMSMLFDASSLKYRIKRMDGYLVPNSQNVTALSAKWC